MGILVILVKVRVVKYVVYGICILLLNVIIASPFFVSFYLHGGTLLERDLDSFSRDILTGNSIDAQLAGTFWTSSRPVICVSI